MTFIAEARCCNYLQKIIGKMCMRNDDSGMLSFSDKVKAIMRSL